MMELTSLKIAVLFLIVRMKNLSTLKLLTRVKQLKIIKVRSKKCVFNLWKMTRYLGYLNIRNEKELQRKRVIE